MSTTRLAFGSILGTLQSTATTVTATLDAANTSVGMLTAFVQQAADNQRFRQIADREDFIENLILEKSEQRATSVLKVEKFCAKSPEHKEHYKSAYEVFTKLLRPELSE